MTWTENFIGRGLGARCFNGTVAYLTIWHRKELTEEDAEELYEYQLGLGGIL